MVRPAIGVMAVALIVTFLPNAALAAASDRSVHFAPPPEALATELDAPDGGALELDTAEADPAESAVDTAELLAGTAELLAGTRSCLRTQRNCLQENWLAAELVVRRSTASSSLRRRSVRAGWP